MTGLAVGSMERQSELSTAHLWWLLLLVYVVLMLTVALVAVIAWWAISRFLDLRRCHVKESARPVIEEPKGPTNGSVRRSDVPTSRPRPDTH